MQKKDTFVVKVTYSCGHVKEYDLWEPGMTPQDRHKWRQLSEQMSGTCLCNICHEVQERQLQLEQEAEERRARFPGKGERFEVTIPVFFCQCEEEHEVGDRFVIGCRT